MSEARRIAFVVAGSLDQRTGGYLYDRAMVDGLRSQGRTVDVHELAGAFPLVDEAAQAAAAGAIDAIADADIRIIDGLALVAFAGLADRIARPWIALVHHPLGLETGLTPEQARSLTALETDLLRRPDRIVVTSPQTVRDLAGMDVPSDRIAVVVPGTARAEGDMPERHDPPRQLLSVASVTPRKGFPLLIEALAPLRDRDWHLAIAGSTTRDPGEAARVREAIAANGLTDRIDLKGELNERDLASLYDRADLFVFASYHEGYGMALAEALSHGLPIVSTNAGAIADTVPETAGILVPPGDAKAMTEALRTVFDDSATFQRLLRGAGRAALDLPTWDDSVATLVIELDRRVRS
ncbi:glycosyltransferase family 4 protein [Marinivivus vitaminiproducens]|uniref:glycosyltransferase family 4 protein n=1 Tax=Marinivivus vitaminiproducens TaxID=3035935 RepID=UPI0027AA5729|nr:glycosyltransferase family 4 protein [Geminicoccaceae bacterium SCSIO 64248]